MSFQKYLQVLKDLECVLKYIFLKDGRYGISIGYSEVHAETINEIF